ncbi:MAG: hypothetical protein Q7T03_02175 [Deltaproteobacteria bacterium]|nr:hypothetical protein [Deltaproteobacteria bacterium]
MSSNLQKLRKKIKTTKGEDFILTLHRYFIWANRMRTHFDDCLKEKNESKEKNGFERIMYMSLWYAGLYVVCEGWAKLNLTDKSIDDLLKSKNLKLLKIYRHGVYHFQKEYYGKCFDRLISEGDDVVRWVRSLNQAFGKYFLEWIK